MQNQDFGEFQPTVSEPTGEVDLPLAEEKLSNIQEFLAEIKSLRQKQEAEKEFPKIKVALTLGRLAFFYEKIRNTLEYKDEHLIIKSALERILKRRFFNYHSVESLAKNIIFDLVGGGYFQSEEIPEAKVSEIADILERYNYLFHATKITKGQICSIVSCAIEEILRPEVKEKEALVNFTLKTIKENLSLDTPLEPDTIFQELYIAIHRTLLKSDYQTIKYQLLRRGIPELEKKETNPIRNKENFSTESGTKISNGVNLSDLSLHFQEINVAIDGLIKSKLRLSFLKLCRRAIPPFSVLGKIVATTPLEEVEAALKNEEEFNKLTDNVYSKWWERASSKVAKTTIKSITFIFLTKMVLAFVLEIPYDLLVIGQLNIIPLVLNLTFPPMYMFLSTFNISVPGKENLKIIRTWLKKMLSGEELNYQLRLRKASSLKTFVFSLVYALTFIISFGVLVFALLNLKFNIISGILFFTFFSTVSFFAYRISQTANELSMIKKGGGFLELIGDFFSIPFIRLGRFLSSNFRRLNIFLFILDFIIETPFKTLLQFLEEWVRYAKEKKEDILND